MYSPIVNPHELTAEGATGNPSYFQAMLNAYKGLEAAQKPHKMMEEILKQQIENKYAPRKNEAALANSEASTANMRDTHGMAGLRRQLLQSNINKANNPPLTGDAGFIEYLLRNKERLNGLNGQQEQPQEQEQEPQFGEGEPSAMPSIMPRQKPNQQAYADKLIQGLIDKHSGKKTYAPSITQKQLDEQADVDAGFYPGTGRQRPFENQEIHKKYQDVYNEHNTGLTKGSHFIYNEAGKPIGEQRKKTPHEREIEKGTVLFKEFYPIINEGLNRYSGEDSIRNMESDARNYKTDPKARKRFDQLQLALKLEPLTTVTEAARFGAGKQNQVFNQFNRALSSFDVPSKIASLIKQYQIPASSNIKAGLRYAETLNKGEQRYAQEASPNIVEYYSGQAPKQSSGEPSEKEINEEAKYFGVSPKVIRDGLAAGVRSEDEFRDWIKGLK